MNELKESAEKSKAKMQQRVQELEEKCALFESTELKLRQDLLKVQIESEEKFAQFEKTLRKEGEVKHRCALCYSIGL